MKLSALLEGFQVQVVHGSLDVSIQSATDDSRSAGPGAMFVAREGTSVDGHLFIDDAIERGAAAVLCQDSPPHAKRGDVAIVTSAQANAIGPIIAARLAGDPSRTLKLIGITGTNGKTTTAHLIQHVLNHSGLKCALIGTVVTDDGAERRPSELTTPSAYSISALLARMLANGCKACVMEVSSHALAQQRVGGLRFAGAVFTNLTGDHLDYHGTVDAYADAKARLFAMLDSTGVAVINVDDPQATRMIRDCRGRIVRTSLNDADAEASAIIEDAGATATRTRFRGPWGDIHVDLPLTGRHNVCNALQALTMCHAIGALAPTALQSALEQCSAPPGRLERVSPQDCPFSVFVDYAHTDDALRNVLSSLKPLVPAGSRLIVVFGCGGDRDRTKRPRMARAAWEFADRVFITSDNPRTEDPLAIIAEIERGVPTDRLERTVRESDRERAIHRAIESAREGDIVIIAGKGHEDYQIVGRTKRPFDDRIVARRALSSLAELAAT